MRCYRWLTRQSEPSACTYRARRDHLMTLGSTRPPAGLMPMEQGTDRWDTATGKVSRGWALIRVHGTCAAGRKPARGASITMPDSVSNSRLSDMRLALVGARGLLEIGGFWPILRSWALASARGRCNRFCYSSLSGAHHLGAESRSKTRQVDREWCGPDHPNPCKLNDSRSAEFWNRTTCRT